MTTTKPFQLGSVSTGTLRPEDLLGAFDNCLRGLMEQFGYHEGHYALHQAAFLMQAEWPDDDTPICNLIEQIELALDFYSPPFVYFGSHPGDGADFGYFPDMDGLQQAMMNEGICEAGDFLDMFGEHVVEDCIVRIHELPNLKAGNVTVMDKDHNVLWTTV